jgi:hypothetical protein
MTTQPERIAAVEMFKEIKKQTKADDVACAILVVVESLKEVTNKAVKFLTIDRLSHEICMGVRHGLFGSGEPHENIQAVAGDIAQAMRDKASE